MTRIEKSKAPSVSTKNGEMDNNYIKFSAIFNRKLARAVLSKCTVEQIAQYLRRGTFVYNLKETVLNIQIIMYELSSKDHRKVFTNGISKHYSAICMCLVLTAMRAMQEEDLLEEADKGNCGMATGIRTLNSLA